MISSYVVAAIKVPSASTFSTKSPGLILPDFRACPGAFGPPSTNLAIRHPYIGASLTGSNCKPTGPGAKITVFSVPIDENKDNRGSVAESIFPTAALDLLADVDCGVRRTLTFFLRLDCIDRCRLSTLLRNGVPNFLAAFKDVRCCRVKNDDEDDNDERIQDTFCLRLIHS